MFHVVTPFRNAAPYLLDCLASLRAQSVTDWQCWLYDDASTDASRAIAESVLGDSRFHLTSQAQPQGLTWNYSCFRQEPQVQAEDIVVSLDGDDRLASNYALDMVQDYYQRFPHLWLTWGSYLRVDAGGRTTPGVSRPVADVSQARKRRWRTSHLRTCRAFLLRAIQEADLLDQQGSYYSPAGDMALMFPLLELATNKHACYIPQYLYLYNAANPCCDHQLHLEAQRANERWLRSRPAYAPYVVDHPASL